MTPYVAIYAPCYMSKVFDIQLNKPLLNEFPIILSLCSHNSDKEIVSPNTLQLELWRNGELSLAVLY